MIPYIWQEIDAGDVDNYINRALRVTDGEQVIQGLLLEVYPDYLLMEIDENHQVRVNNDTYMAEDTRLEIVKVIKVEFE